MSIRILILTLIILASIALAAAGVNFLQTRESVQPQVFELTELPEQEAPAEEEALAAAEVAESGDDAEDDPQEEIALIPEMPEEPLPAVSENAGAHLCYMSFNNPYEASVARNFARALAEYPESPKITVTEYQGDGADPEDALERLVRSGTRCDGLVLSGHHDEDGEFWGDRTSGDLEIDFLYELAARPEYGAWFSQVKALWLQGCHTATTRVFNPDVKKKYRITGSPLDMVNRYMDMDDIEDTVDDLNDIFLENTEEDNIILDYSRVFPAATVYTWWDKSPGVESGSHWSFPFHIVQTSFVIDPAPRFFQHPFKKPIPKAAALRYGQILYEMMTRPTYPYRHEGPLQSDEDTFIKGWKEHGRWAVHRRQHSFENASAIGHRSLLASQSGILRQLRGFTLLLEQYDEKWVAETPAATVQFILDNEEHIPFNVYLLWSIAQRAPSLKARMSASAELNRHLYQVIEAPNEDGQLKSDYRRFHAFLYGETKAEAEIEE